LGVRFPPGLPGKLKIEVILNDKYIAL